MTPKQEAFVREYLIDLNATQAAIRAGYSEKTAMEQGYQLLQNTSVAAAIKAGQEALAEKAQVTKEQIVAEFIRMGFYDPASIAGQPMSGPEDIPNLPEDVRRSIVGWGWDRAGNFTLKLADKNAALVSLGRHLGMFTDKLDVKGDMSITVTPEDAGL